MEEENEREGISLGELWKIIKKRLWIVLLCAVLAAVGTYFYITLYANPPIGYYIMEFTFNYPGKETLKYPDGTPYYYQDVISLEALQRVKNSDEKFAGIDVEELVSKNLIEISAEMEKGETEMEQYKERYTIRAIKKQFASREIAKEFLRAIANSPAELVKNRAAMLSYDLSDETFSSAYSYQDQIQFLNAVRTRLLNQYDEWDQYFRENYRVSGVALKDYRTEVEAAFSNIKSEDLLKQIKTYDYVPLNRLDEKIAELTEEKRYNEKKIQELEKIIKSEDVSGGKSESVNSVAEMLGKLYVDNVDIDRKLEALTKENIQAFETVLKNEYAQLEALAEKTRQVALSLFSQETHITFTDPYTVKEGGSNVVIITVGAAVIGFLISGAVVYGVEASRKKRQKNAEETPDKAENGQ